MARVEHPGDRANERTIWRFNAGCRADAANADRIEANGIVDARTAAAINKESSALERVVRGNALQADGQPLARAKVRAFDKALRSETQLGEATCDAAGYFEIRYVYASPDKSAPALLLKAFANARAAKTVAVSEVLFDARPEAIINLVAGGAPFRGLSEFERVLSDLKPLIDGDRVTIADLAENDEIKDVTFLEISRQDTPLTVSLAQFSLIAMRNKAHWTRSCSTPSSGRVCRLSPPHFFRRTRAS